MKMFFISTLSLFVIGTVYARAVVPSINILSARLDMPELYSVGNPAELEWFASRSHITKNIVFFSSLMSELKKTEAFPENRHVFAKYGIRRYLNMSPNDQALVDPEVPKNCLKILSQGGKFNYLIELTVKIGAPMMSLLDLIEADRMKGFTEALLVSHLRDPFMEALRSYEPITGFKVHLYGHLILSHMPESFYIDYLTSNMNLVLSSVMIALGQCAKEGPMDMANVRKVQNIFDAIVDPQAQPILDSIKDVIKVINSPADVSLADFGLDASLMAFQRKFAFTINAGNHSKDILLREIIASLNETEMIIILKSAFASSKSFEPSGLKVAVKIYNLLSEEIRGPVHESLEYLQAAVQYLKLDHLEIFSEGDFSHKFTFRADPEQIVDGLFAEMTYYHRRSNPVSCVLMSAYGTDLKFHSSKAFENFISQDIRRIFREPFDFSLPISKDTLNLLAENENLRLLVAQHGYKIMLKEAEVLEFIEDTPIERIPKMSNLIRITFFNLDLLSKINESANLSKIEKFTGQNIANIVKIALDILKEPVTEAQYFKIRNALVYWMNGPQRLRLNELPELMKKLVIEEFPVMRDNLTF